VRADPPEGSLAGNYAGPVTRLGAYAVDAFAVVTTYGLMLSLISFVWQLLTREDLALPVSDSLVWLIGLGIWTLVYFGGCWALAAKTPGMAVLGIRVVERDGKDLHVRRAFLRALAFPLSFALLGLGFVGIVVGRERRALHDVIAGTTVVYDWDARAPRFRLLSREASAA
jgi:uncharacterized RDD family membrane protein YckC